MKGPAAGAPWIVLNQTGAGFWVCPERVLPACWLDVRQTFSETVEAHDRQVQQSPRLLLPRPAEDLRPSRNRYRRRYRWTAPKKLVAQLDAPGRRIGNV